jgi:NH3-dependent NAD+ synthetase
MHTPETSVLCKLLKPPKKQFANRPMFAEPITEDYVQSDEVDMGMSYDELSV